MADINDTNNLISNNIDIIKENILNTSSDEDNTSNKLYNIFKEVKTKIDEFKTYYSSITSQELSTIATFGIAIIDIIYMSDMNRSIDNYKKISEFVAQLLSDDSIITQLIKSIEDNYIIYSRTKDNATKNIIINLLNELAQVLRTLLIDTGIVPTDYKINKKPEEESTGSPFDFTVSSDLYRSINTTYSNNVYHLWYGTIDKAGWVAQKSEVFISQDESTGNTGPINVSIPVMKINNLEFEYDQKTIAFIVNVRNYLATYSIENDGSSDSDPYTTKKASLRCGSWFAPLNAGPLETRSMPIQIQLDTDDPTISKGNVDYFGNTVNKNISVVFNFEGENADPALYPNTKLADSIDLTRVFEFSSDELRNTRTTYTLHGTLDFDEERSNNTNEEIATLLETIKANPDAASITDSYDIRAVSYFKGTVTIENNSIDYDSLTAEEQVQYDSQEMQRQKTVLVEIRANDNGTYDIMCDNDPDTTISSISINENLETILPNMVIRFTQKNCEMNNEVVFASDSEKVAQALLALSNLNIDNNFESNFGEIWNVINNSKNSLTRELVRLINHMSEMINTLILIHSEYANALSSYNDETLTDVVNDLSELGTNFNEYISTDTFDPTELFNGVFYNNVTSSLLSIQDSLINILNEISDTREKLEDLEHKIFIYTDTEKIEINASDVIRTFYNLLTANTTTAETLSSVGQTYNVYSLYTFDEWLSIFNGIANNASYAIPINYKYYLYCFFTLRYLISRIKSPSNDKYYNAAVLNEQRLVIYYYNHYARQGVNEDIDNIIKAYKQYNLFYTGNDNSFFINPDLLTDLPGTELFNYIELEETLTTQFFSASEDTYSGIVYSGILNNKFENIENILYKKLNFIKTYKSNNIREELFIFYILQACDYLTTTNMEFYYKNGICNIHHSEIVDLKEISRTKIISYLRYKDAYKNKTIGSSFIISENF